MKSKIFTISLLSLLVFSIFISSPVTQVAAVGDVSASVQPGDNYYFDVASFPSFQELIDLAGDQPDGAEITATGGLETSEIYLKVISVQDETQTFFDGVNDVTTNSVPTVDFTAGMITGDSIGISVKNTTTNANIASATLPAGVGLPLPAVLGTSTYFNVSAYDGGAFLPVPFVLNDDWTTHAAVAGVLETMAENDPANSIAITNDPSQFKVDFDVILGDENETVAIEGSATWAKDTGLVNQLVVQFYNRTTGVDLVSLIDISLNSAKTKNVPVLVEVGDTFDVVVSQAGFDFTTTGFTNPDDSPVDDMTFIQDEMDNIVGETLLSLEVVETHGMYYRVDGTVRVNDTYDQPITDGGEAWMVGFGRAGPGMMMNLAFNDNNNNNDSYGYYSNLGLNSITQAERRVYAAPGFVVSADWDIYAAWDKTLAFATSVGLTTFLEVLQSIEEGPDFMLGSSTDDSPDFTALWVGGENADGGYTTTLSASADVTSYTNDSWYEGGYYDYYSNWIPGWDAWHLNDVKVDASAAIEVSHAKHGELDYLKLTADISIEVYEAWNNENGTVTTHGPVTVNIENGIVEFDATMTRVNPIVDDTSSTDNPSGTTSEAAPGLDLPGFEFSLAIMSFVAVAFISKKRR